MLFKSTTVIRKLLSELRASILALREGEKTYGEIVRQMKLSRATVITIVHRVNRQRNVSLFFKKRMGRPFKLDDRGKRALIRHVERYFHDNLHVLATFLKSGCQLSRTIVRKYLIIAGYLRYKARKKFYLTVRHKAARLIWGRKHKDWTVEDWGCVVWTDEATFETGLDSRSCYVTRRKSTVMEVRYLKATFKSGRSSIGIWGSITLKKKGSMHILSKKRRMNFEIYINEVLKPLGLSFFKQCLATNPKMIYMDDGADYHTSKRMIQ